MKIIDIFLIIFVIIIGLALGFFSGMYPALDWIYVLVYIYGIYLVISKNHKVKPKWASLIASFLLPGLGQVIYAKQWLKMAIYLGTILGGTIALTIMFILEYLSPIPYLILLILGMQIYNLIDAYNIGKEAEEINKQIKCK